MNEIFEVNSVKIVEKSKNNTIIKRAYAMKAKP